MKYFLSLLLLAVNCFAADVIVTEEVTVGNSVERRQIKVSSVARTTGQYDKTNTTLANIPGLSLDVTAGRTYSFEAVLIVDADVTGGHKYSIDGSCTATTIIYVIKSVNTATLANVIAKRRTAMAGNASEVGSTEVITEIKGLITAATSGTLTVRFAQSVASGTSSVINGYFVKKDMH